MSQNIKLAKSLIIPLILIFALTLPLHISAEDGSNNTSAEPTRTPTPTRTPESDESTETEHKTATTEATDAEKTAKKATQEARTAALKKLRTDQKTSSDAEKLKRTQIKTEFKDARARLEATKKENMAEYEKLKADFKAKTALNKSVIKENLDEIQVKRLENFKNAAGLAEARIHKGAEFLYSKLKFKRAELEAHKAEGFDTTASLAKLDAIEDKIAAAEAKAAQFGPLYENIETLSIDQIKANILEAQKLTKSIISDFKRIKQEIADVKQ